jgi:hypothetical protein
MTLALGVVFASVVASAGLIMYFRGRSRRKPFEAREDADLERLWASSKTNATLPLFEDVFRTIAKQLRVRPGQLRPSDRLAEIFKVDSWQLGGAQDALEELILKKTPNRPPPVDTVQDLLNWLANEQSK